MTKRIGASSRSRIPADVLSRLNDGTLESATLAEGLAVDFAQLLSTVCPPLSGQASQILTPTLGITKRMRLAGELLAAHYGPSAITHFSKHTSDTVRGWTAYVVGTHPDFTLAERVTAIRPLAGDPHFGVREWAWIAVREAFAQQIDRAISLLAPWTREASASLRRFASESTRPRGVWCAHIQSLKDKPEAALPILEPLRSDGAKYVRDSVANWLNDAGKSCPQWVREVCRRWKKESPTPETEAIVKRAQRNLV